MGAMKIDRSNYEEFIIGYLDGTLDPVRTAELLIFLEQNPDLKEEAAELASISLKPDSGVVFTFKDSLIQPPDQDAIHLNTSNYNHYFIAAHEGDLSAVGLKAVERFIQRNPGLKNDYELYHFARLKADSRIVYPEPSSLKKPVAAGIKRIIYLGAAAVAAGILLLISFYLRQEPGATNPIAENFAGKQNPPRETIIRDTVKTNVSGVSSTVKTNDKPVKPASIEKKKTKSETQSPSGENKEPEPVEVKRIQAQPYINHTPEPFNSGNRNFYSSLFDDIVKSQESMLASLEPETSSAGRLPLSGTQTVKRLNNFIRSGAQIVSQMPGSLNGWMLADIGIEGINMLTDNDIKLQRIAKPDGQTEKVIISENGSGYAFSRKPN
jgi:hypothetical protein